MAELVFEIFCEEIPARMQLNAAKQLQETFLAKTNELGLFHNHCKSFVTPRRLTLFVDGLSLTQEDSVTEKRGPRVDAGDEAIEGFLRGSGLSRNQLDVKSTPKGDFYFAIIRQKGKPTKEILKTILEDILNNFSWPKSQRWGEYRIRWVRPIQNIACIFGGEILDIQFGHLKANNKSYGHRFMGNEEFSFENFANYERNLHRKNVILDHEERHKIIESQTHKLAKDNGLDLIEDAALMNEVTGLVEFPNIMMGSIDAKFADLPEEVLLTSMRTHQKYFCTRDVRGNLSPYFIFISNMTAKDGGHAIIRGNERVLRARLSDGRFFYDQDREKGLENMLPKLKDMVFHAAVGTVFERIERIEKIASEIASEIASQSKPLVLRAAKLCKADLASDMVGEFPELQGIMGYYYAIEAGEDKHVAEAIRKHYSPLGPNDSVPTGSVSAIVALADKIDAITSLFSAGERATGSKDPFALRRLALGIIRIILENKIILPLSPLFKKAVKLLPSSTFKKTSRDEVLKQIESFIRDRVLYQLKSENIRVDAINASLNDDESNQESLDIFNIKKTAILLASFMDSKEGSMAIDAFKRAQNILSIEQKKDGKEYSPKPSSSVLSEAAEKILYEKLDQVENEVDSLIKEGELAKSLNVLSGLTDFINNYFDKTTINHADKKIRENRLKLTSLIVDVFERVIQF